MSDKDTAATSPAASAAASAATDQRWVAFGPAGAVGSISRTGEGFAVRLMNESDPRGTYPTLDVAKSALHAGLLPGSDWPDFREH